MSGSIQGLSSVLPLSPKAQTQAELHRTQARPPESALPRTFASEGPPSSAVAALERALRALTPELMNSATRLSIEKDKGSGTFIYRAVDRDTGDVVHQWPGEDMLEMMRFLREYDGMLVDDKV